MKAFKAALKVSEGYLREEYFLRDEYRYSAVETLAKALNQLLKPMRLHCVADRALVESDRDNDPVIRATNHVFRGEKYDSDKQAVSGNLEEECKKFHTPSQFLMDTILDTRAALRFACENCNNLRLTEDYVGRVVDSISMYRQDIQPSHPSRDMALDMIMGITKNVHAWEKEHPDVSEATPFNLIDKVAIRQGVWQVRNSHNQSFRDLR
ncbi:MAG: hypothetical protein ACOY3I_01035 [Verrucomicrobiota bacterium]